MCTASAIICTNPLQTAIADVINTNVNKKPNFVTIVIDDMGFSDMGAFGGEVPTPNLGELIDTGTILTNFYAAPTSTPSRAILFTGKDSHPAGVGNMSGFMAGRPEQQGQPGYEGVLSLDALPFPELLQANGYHTMMTGKWDLGEEPGFYASDRGFDQTFVLLPGGDMHFLSDENGKVVTSQPPGYYAKLGRTSPYNENGQEVTEFPPNAYSSTLYTDKAIEMLDNRDTSKPFYLNVSHIATHFPLQAPAEITAKYIEVYAQGWDVLREQRFENLKALGLVSQDAEQPPRWDNVPAWDSLDAEEQKFQAKSMAVYAAMTEILDTEVGRLVEHLKNIGEYDNTVFFVYSDNGGAFQLAGNPAKQAFVAENFTDDTNYEDMGNISSYIGYGIEWSMLSNTPFNNHKSTTFDGGIHVPGFVHYPQSKLSGIQYDCLHSSMDIAPTVLDMAGIAYPDTYNGKPISPMQGISMAGIFDGILHCNNDRWLGWEMDGIKGVRQGNWKLAQQLNDENFYLFDLWTDPFELNDLSDSEPEKFGEMLGIYQQYVQENGVIEVSNKKLKLLASVDGPIDSNAAVFTGGVALLGRPAFNKKANVKPSDKLEVAGQIRPKPEHVGLNAEVSVVATYYPTPEAEPNYLALTKEGFVGISDKDNPPPFMTAPMQSALFIPIFTGQLEGTYTAELCYQIDDGTKICSEEPIEVMATDE